MDTSKICFEKRLNLIDIFISIVIAISAIIGIILVKLELNETQKQTEYLNRTLMQSYRPVGSIANFKDDGTYSNIIIHYFDCDKKDKFSFLYNPEIMNRGQGILSLIGYISYLSEKSLNFREKFLNGEITEVYADSLLNYARRKPILPKDKYGVVTVFKEIPFEQKYFIYVLAFYEDQDNNLYDTEHLVVLNFEEPKITEDGLKTKLNNNEPGIRSERYSMYNKLDYKRLSTVLKRINSPLSNYISKLNYL